jgi:hypothetical protein
MCHYDITVCRMCNTATKVELIDRCPGGVIHFSVWFGAHIRVVSYTCRWCLRLTPP